MLSERLHDHARTIMGAALSGGHDVGITVATADEWLHEFMAGDPPPRPDPEVTEWRQAVGLPVAGG